MPLSISYQEKEHLTYDLIHGNLHAHPFCELMFIADGSAAFTYNGSDYHVKRGDLLFIQQGIEHQEEWEEAFSFYTIAVKDYNVLPDGGFIFDTGSEFEIFRSYFQLLFHELTKPDGYNQKIIKNLFLCLMAVCERAMPIHYNLDLVSSREKHKIRNNAALSVKYYIDSYYYVDFKLDDLAKMAYISPQYLVRTFKLLTGYTPMRYLALLRIQIACSKLLERTDPIGKLHTSLGFTTYDAFAYNFKKEIGLSPKQFRAKYFQNVEEGLKKTSFVTVTTIDPLKEE